MSPYWSWWLGALALGAITVGYHFAIGRRFGVSSSWERVVHWGVERRAERIDEELLADDAAFEAALRAATMEEFGERRDVAVEAPPAPPAASIPAGAGGRLPLSANAALLVSITLGALAAALFNGRFQIRADMGEDFSALVTDGHWMWPILFVGGVMVGLGTRMAGGCSSGHGLSGVSRLQPVSLLATAVFFGSAVVVSTLLWKVI